MGEIHRLPTATASDDRRLIDVTLGELKAVVAAEVRRLLDGVKPEADWLTVSRAAKKVGASKDTVRDWCKTGCDECGERLPSVMTGDTRGRKIDSTALGSWMAKHRSAEGCRG